MSPSILRWTHAILILITALGAGCVTNDFKVVDALRPGLSHSEAADIIAGYGFEKESATDRPRQGWQRDGTFENLGGRAAAVEQKLQQPVSAVELYPVHHGVLGYGLLFLFYGADERLLHFYRYQIN